MKPNFKVALLVLVSLLLSACGGGSSTSEPAPAPSAPIVHSVEVVPKFANKTLITVKGNYLLNAISGTATGACTVLTEEPNSTDSQVVYSCTPQKTGIGALAISIVAKANNALLQAKNLDVLEPQVTMITAQGSIVVELNPTAAPLSVNNFLNYVNANFYTNTLFHRIINGFVVQGGGYTSAGVAKTVNAPVAMEAPAITGLSNKIGTIALARSTNLDSATSQFYFNTVDNLSLDAGPYAVFGKVISGMDVVAKLEALPVTNSIPKNFADALLISATQTQ